ncbi:MAG: BrnT family toxin [Pseudomonadota bacterium]
MASSDWVPKKDAGNQGKHGLSFLKSQYAFADPRRVIAGDIIYRTAREERYFCFGDLGDGIVTVRFTWRKHIIRILGPAFWTTGSAKA